MLPAHFVCLQPPLISSVRQMQQHPSPSQLRSVALGTVVLALLPLWEAWSVLSSGSMAGIHCNGLFAGTLCAVGSNFGTVVFGSKNAYLGYAVVSGGLGLLLLVFAWRAFLRAKQHP
jgi:hypothetical protein